MYLNADKTNTIIIIDNLSIQVDKWFILLKNILKTV